MDSIINLQKKIVPELTNLLVQRYQILRQVSHEYPIGRRALAARLGLSERVLRAQVFEKRWFTGIFFCRNVGD